MGGIVGLVKATIWRLRGGVSVTDATLDPGGGPNVSAEHFQPAGDDAAPLPGDYGYAGPGPQKGRYAVVGYLDAKNPPVAVPGEKRIYSRDQGGEVKAAVWLKGDGTILLQNDNGSLELRLDGSMRGQNAAGWFELLASGEFQANGARLTITGDVVTSDGVSLRNHPHVPSGPPPIPTE